jgi:glycosyltransferase involved in cell wall biosynthesis
MSLDWLLGPQLVAFVEAGYEVIGMSAPGPHVRALRDVGIEHVALDALTRSSEPLQDLRAFRQLVQELRRLRPDILHTHNPKPGVMGRIAGRLTRVPLVINTQHGLYAQPGDRWQRRWPVYGAERFAAAFGDHELVQNTEDVSTLVHVLRVPARKVSHLGNGVDLHRFDPSTIAPGARARLRAEWAVAEDEIVCLVVGRLVREKGMTELLESDRALRAAGTRVRTIVIGPVDGDKADAVDPTSLGRTTDGGVVFAGQRDDMPECYAAADLFVTASWREGMPRAAMEAAAMALPTVATDIRGNRQVVIDGVTGLLVEVRDAAALAHAISQLALDPVRRHAFGDAARRLALEEFDQVRVIDRTLATYRTSTRRR